MTGYGKDGTECTGDDCEKALSRLYEFLDSELDASDADEIRHHLAACEPCLDAFDAEEAMKKLIKRGCGDEPAPEQLRAKVMAVFASRTTITVRQS
ncbi:mycothiol system anti-sigma-R factor [Microlunatus soli]|uniref:Mycothiol system anti-sigma-R factor n=1 Tax=Microlunatus soli TaxID=630515 RepID=A0A1H1MHM3_9ACTN|nr:mycothiol system anti-sigma-R factor [Microlunatus soli]SDR86268.1 mycothiol system anti-sigma-R factor [Microlunatus soli]